MANWWANVGKGTLGWNLELREYDRRIADPTTPLADKAVLVVKREWLARLRDTLRRANAKTGT